MLTGTIVAMQLLALVLGLRQVRSEQAYRLRGKRGTVPRCEAQLWDSPQRVRSTIARSRGEF